MRWKFAKTMPDWSREYMVKDWWADLVAEFEAFCRVTTMAVRMTTQVKQ